MCWLGLSVCEFLFCLFVQNIRHLAELDWLQRTARNFWTIETPMECHTKFYEFEKSFEPQALIDYYCCRLVTLVWTVDDAVRMASVLATLSVPYVDRQRYQNRSLRAHHCIDRVFAVDSTARKRLDIILTPEIAPKTHHSLCSLFATWPDDVSLYGSKNNMKL